MSQQGYRLEFTRHKGNVTAFQDNQTIASSAKTTILHETRLKDCFYFPFEAVNSEILTPSEYRSFCPFKGTASYWHVDTPNGLIKNGAWSYQNPLEVSEPIGGLISFDQHSANQYAFEVPHVPDYSNDGHIQSPLTDWIIREAGRCQTRQELVKALCHKLLDSGIAITRLRIMIWSLHPQIAGVSYTWSRNRDTVEITEPGHSMFENPGFINSPVNLVSKGLGGVRQPLNVNNKEFEFPIMQEMKEQGGTDYVAMPLRFSNGQNNCLTMTSDHPDGFTTQNLGLVFECVGVISRYFEVLTLRSNTTSILNTYLGERTGQRVLNGDITRGQGEDIDAIILFSDLRNSTRLSASLPRDQYLQVLNQYFETILDPVKENGGEVLKFIGDAVLAIFPISKENDAESQAEAALKAAQNAIANSADCISSPYESILGISLHLGAVTYGNVGGKDRLDFTVIGPAVNLASRLEGLCKPTGNAIVLSRDFKAALSGCAKVSTTIKSIGNHQLDGIEGKEEVFAVEVK